MTWLPLSAKGLSDRDAVLGLIPDAYRAQQVYLDACAEIIDGDVLMIVRARMAQLLRCREELARHDPALLADLDRWWEESTPFTPLQRDALSFVEQFLMDPSLISSELSASLEREWGTFGVLNFTTAVSGFEGSLRLSTFFDLEPTS